MCLQVNVFIVFFCMCLGKNTWQDQKIKLTDAEIGIYYKMPYAVIKICTLFCFLYVFDLNYKIKLER